MKIESKFTRSSETLVTPSNSSARGGRVARRLAWGVAPVAWLVGWQFVAAAGNGWADLLAVTAFVVAVLLCAAWVQPYRADDRLWAWSWRHLLVAALLLVAWGIYRLTGSSLAAWMIVAALAVFAMQVEACLEFGRRRVARWGVRGLVALSLAALLAVMGQFEQNFSGEEFDTALQIAVLLPFWWLIFAAWNRYAGSLPAHPEDGRRVAVTRRTLVIVLAVSMVAVVFLSVRGYQGSFFPAEAPAFPGIRADEPYLCGELPGSRVVDARAVDAHAVQQELIAQLEANPQKGTPEYGMLALSTQAAGWAEAFRASVLQEAAEQRYTGPAHSVKYSQYLAALRLYYVERVRQQFPDLFTADEVETLHAWFAAINERAMTVEWVDWMYGLAFAMWPRGPYENQEIGTGLLALLEATGFADPGHAAANRAYLDESARGWQRRFRNIDDTYLYQREWITNAYFYSLYAPEVDEARQARAFEWLLLQMLPDGTPPPYNHPVEPSMAATAYMAAHLLGDPRYVWLAEQVLAAHRRDGVYPYAQPGAEYGLDVQGESPTQSSCLLYGDSGLPNQVGPLAPDKVIFRDGWAAEDAYLLLNLRFTGWHRYKATNTVAIVYQGQKLIADSLQAPPSRWLPEGRSLVRDKRIPRETLSGLVIRNSGLSEVLRQLTGVGSRWAQDPPPYATVVDFRTNEVRGEMTVDWSHTQVAGWRGWQHDRWVHFYHDGPIVVVDRANGPTPAEAAITWQAAADLPLHDAPDRYMIGDEAHPTELVVASLSLGPEGQDRTLCTREGESSSIWCAGTSGQIASATVLLADEWVGADVSVEYTAEAPTIVISQDGLRLEVEPYP